MSDLLIELLNATLVKRPLNEDFFRDAAEADWQLCYYEAVNACFAKHGVLVDSVDGHHAYLKIDGISVEHHFAFHNTKVKRGLESPEETLQQLAAKNWQPTSIKGICFPNPVFTALFVGWHAYEHFLQEKIQLRHVLDWALSLKQLTKEDAETLKAAKGDSRWGRFMDTMTAIAIHQLNLPQQCFPLTELEAAKTITLEQEQKVWNDIINTVQTQKSNSSNLRRIYIAKRMLKNNWKYKTYSNMSACQLVLNETIAHFRAKRQKILKHQIET